MLNVRTVVASLSLLVIASVASAWDAHGHRTITLLAVEQFSKNLKPEDKPAELEWLFTADSRAQAGYQSGEPDRYRSTRSAYLKHENDPDHYIDVEDLEQFGLTLSTIPPLRYEYLRDMAIAKHEHPENVRPYNEKTDMARTQEWPGYLPYAIMEHYGKLTSSFRQVRVIESRHDPERANQLAAARANVIYEMGQLAHFVGDGAQPLHTTQHHHGWVGDNPNGYTTNKGIHSYIDSSVLGIHHLDFDSLKDVCKSTHTIDGNDPFKDTLAYIQTSFDQVRPLYELQKSGDLDKEPGKAFITERLCDGAGMLSAMYLAAWRASVITTKDTQDFIKYEQQAPATPKPLEDKPRGEPALAVPTETPSAKP